jgi:hypothetical protein
MAPLEAKEADRQIRAECRSKGLDLNKSENALIIASKDAQGSWSLHPASTLSEAERVAKTVPGTPPIFIMSADEQHGILVLKGEKLVPAQ